MLRQIPAIPPADPTIRIVNLPLKGGNVLQRPSLENIIEWEFQMGAVGFIWSGGGVQLAVPVMSIPRERS